jgi:hypothetical protein
MDNTIVFWDSQLLQRHPRTVLQLYVLYLYASPYYPRHLPGDFFFPLAEYLISLIKEDLSIAKPNLDISGY